MTHTWCKFCEENQNENTYEVKRNVRDKIFVKRPDTMIIVLDWYEIEDVMVVNVRNTYCTTKRKLGLPRTSSTPRSCSQSVDTQIVRTSSNQGVSSPLPSSKYNIFNQLDNIKSNSTLLDMVSIP
jgi:hypothetical protein